MKKILVISPIQIFPPLSGGQIRTASLCEAFAANGWNVTVFSYTGRKCDYLNGKQSFEQSIKRNLKEFIYLNPLFGLLQHLTYRFDWPPLWLTVVSFFFRPRFLKLLMNKHNFLLVDFPYAFPLAYSFSGEKWLNTHNVESHLWKKNPIWSNAVRIFELKSLYAFDRILCCTNLDKNYFDKELPSIQYKTSVLPHNYGGFNNRPSSGAQFDVKGNFGIKKEEAVILFVGSSYGPNKEAVTFLESFFDSHKTMLEKLKISFLVVGSVCVRDLTKKGFYKVGPVDELASYFDASDFAINPVVLGSGVNIKILDYVLAGLPVLTTEFGLRGLPLRDGQECFVFERGRLMSAIERVISTPAEVLGQVRIQAHERLKRDFDMTKNLKNFLDSQLVRNEELNENILA